MPLAAVRDDSPTTGRRPPAAGRLVQMFEDVFASVVRLRVRAQEVGPADEFRRRAVAQLARAKELAESEGYEKAHRDLALFAATALLDETALRRTSPFADAWRPIALEAFKESNAGVRFFGYVDKLLKEPQSPVVADVLEVFHAALLLGFRGRFDERPAERDVVVRTIKERVDLTRGGLHELSPAWRIPEEPPTLLRPDPWIPRLAILAAALSVAVLGMTVAYRSALSARVDDFRQEFRLNAR